jgi:hypothetical protein
LRFSGFKIDKFAAKFAQAGNLKLRHVSQFLDSPLAQSSLASDRFPQAFFPQPA